LAPVCLIGVGAFQAGKPIHSLSRAVMAYGSAPSLYAHVRASLSVTDNKRTALAIAFEMEIVGEVEVMVVAQIYLRVSMLSDRRVRRHPAQKIPQPKIH
jgi:hypothetical protein